MQVARTTVWMKLMVKRHQILCLAQLMNVNGIIATTQWGILRTNNTYTLPSDTLERASASVRLTVFCGELETCIHLWNHTLDLKINKIYIKHYIHTYLLINDATSDHCTRLFTAKKRKTRWVMTTKISLAQNANLPCKLSHNESKLDSILFRNRLVRPWVRRALQEKLKPELFFTSRSIYRCYFVLYCSSKCVAE
jgi:hypothetical protein